MGLFYGLIGDSLLGADQGSALPVSDMDRYKAAISANESDGNYGLTGPVTRTGDRAYGKYQVMGNNVGPWTKEVLGREMTPSEFLNDPQAQERVFEGKFGQLVTKFGNPQDAASVWFSGRPRAQAGNAHDILGTSVPQYVANFNASLGKQPGQSSMPIDTTAAPQPIGAPDPSQLVLPSERYRNLAQAMIQAGLTRPVKGLGDALLGFSNMLQGNAYGSQYEQQQQAYNKGLGGMLTAAGDDPNKIRTALMGSQSLPLMQAGAQSILSKPPAQIVDVGADPITGTPVKKMMINGKLYELDGKTPFNPGGGVGSATVPGTPGQSAIPAGVHGDELIKAAGFNPTQEALLKGITSYSVPIEQFKRLQTNPQLISMATRYDPTFDAKEYKARQDLLTSFKSKQDANEIKSYGTLVGHVDRFNKNIDALGNYTSPAVNYVRNAVRGQTDTGFQGSVGRLHTDIDTAVSEYNRATTGKPITVEEAKRWHDMVSENASPATMHAVADEMLHLVQSRMEETAQKYNRGMGISPDNPSYKTAEGLLSPDKRALFQKLRGTEQAAAQSAPAVAPAPPNPFGIQGGRGRMPSGVPRQILEGPGGHRIGDYGTGQWIDMETGEPFRAPK